MMAQVARFIAFVATVWGANAAVVWWGVVPVGFGWSAPAGVWLAGLAFTARDALQEGRQGPAWVGAGILLGAGLSGWLSGPLAVASGVAFGLSEALDWAVYTPLRTRGRPVALAASNLVGSAVDSAVFLWLAFGSLAWWPGQMLGKMQATAAVLFIWACWDRWRRARPVTA